MRGLYRERCRTQDLTGQSHDQGHAHRCQPNPDLGFDNPVWNSDAANVVGNPFRNSCAATTSRWARYSLLVCCWRKRIFLLVRRRLRGILDRARQDYSQGIRNTIPTVHHQHGRRGMVFGGASHLRIGICWSRWLLAIGCSIMEYSA